MISEEKVLDKIAEMLGDSYKMNNIYGSEENVAYACGFNDRSLIELLKYVEELAQIGKNNESIHVSKNALNEVIEWITNRWSGYEEKIKTASKDSKEYYVYNELINEEKLILDRLVEI